MKHRLYAFLLAWLLALNALAQPSVLHSSKPTGIRQGRFVGVGVGTAAFYAITLLMLR